MKRVAVLACVIGAGTWAGISSTSTRPRWVATELGTLSFPGTYGIDSAAVAVDARGDVLGESGLLSFPATGAAPVRRAFLWRDGRMNDLGTLGGVVTDGVAVNDAGTVVGSSATRAGAMHAFLWRAGHMTDLGTLGGKSSAAVGINDRGRVIGWSGVSGSSTGRHAFLWERGRMTDLGTLGGWESAPTAINARGQVVGSSDINTQSTSDTSTPGMHAFLWQKGKMTDLGIDMSTAIAINDHGQVLGMSDKPFVWRNGKTTLLPTAGPDFTNVMAINIRGEVLGEALPPRGGFPPGHALLWRNGKRIDLGYDTAWAINDRGDIVGITNGPRGITYGRAILWRNGRKIVLGAEPSGRNNPNDSDVVGPVAIDRQGDEIAATLRRPDGHTRAIVWRLK